MGGWIQRCPKCQSENIINGRLKAFDDKNNRDLTIGFHGHENEKKEFAGIHISQILACFCNDCHQVSLTIY